MKKGSGYISVAVLSNEIEAISIQEYLKEAGIPSMVRRYSIPAFDPSFYGQGAVGIGPALQGAWGELLVPEEKAEEAKNIIEELRKNLDV